MKQLKYFLCGTGLFLLAGPALRAQQTVELDPSHLLLIRQAPLSPHDDSLTVDLTIDAGRLQLASTRSLTLTPVLKGADSLRLPPLLLNGRNRHAVYRRALSVSEEQPDTYYAVRKIAGSDNRTIRYRYTVPYAAWMEKARLLLDEEWCGCGGEAVETRRNPLFAVLIAPAPEPEPFKPHYAYVQPPVEPVKNRTQLADIYLNFPVNQVVIRPDYMNNRNELAKAEEMIRQLNDDSNLTVRQIVIRGYASPEGSVSSNLRLSEGRAAALKNYLRPRLHTASLPMRSESGGEDWEGVIEALKTSTLAGRDALLAAMADGDRSDRAETALRQIDGGAPYRALLQDIYPKVRRVVCSVHYTARAFTVEESREIIRRNPEQLSVEEIFRVADSYPEDSEGFREALYTAARCYPTDEIANVNAAVAALSEGRDTEAAHYLDRLTEGRAIEPDISKAGAEGVGSKMLPAPTEAIDNARGLLWVQRGDYEAAARCFRHAAEAGSVATRQNLAELERITIHSTNNR